ncbi:MAG: dipeptidase [Saprospiraceae bacterium]
MKRNIFLFIFSILFYFEGKAQFNLEDSLLYDKALQLAKTFIIVDGHVDLPYRLKVQNFRFVKEFTGIPVSSDEGDFDALRAKEGGLDAPFMSIYIPASYQVSGGADMLADSLINMVEYIAQQHPDYFMLARNPNDIEVAKELGLIALPMGMENGAPVENDINKIAYFKSRGISYITLTHSKDNKICDSSYDTTRTWKGMSPYGFKVVDEMVRQGIMIDISHVSDQTFNQVLDHVKVPIIASHSSVRRYTPGFERNMDDVMIHRMKENNGVIMINFGTIFLDGTIAEYNQAKRNELRELLSAKGVDPQSEEGKRIVDDFRKSNPVLFADVYKVADHIDHVVQIAGIDHVGLGSDYDGVGDSLPVGLKDVSDYPNLIYVLLQRGYSEEDIAKICYQNIFRVWNEVLETQK